MLASEIYALVARYDSAFVLSDALRIAFARLGLLAPPVVVCTDSYSLYECLVKMGTTTEKRLMIDLAALRQSYERHEIEEVRPRGILSRRPKGRTRGRPQPCQANLPPRWARGVVGRPVRCAWAGWPGARQRPVRSRPLSAPGPASTAPA